MPAVARSSSPRGPVETGHGRLLRLARHEVRHDAVLGVGRDPGQDRGVRLERPRRVEHVEEGLRASRRTVHPVDERGPHDGAGLLVGDLGELGRQRRDRGVRQAYARPREVGGVGHDDGGLRRALELGEGRSRVP